MNAALYLVVEALEALTIVPASPSLAAGVQSDSGIAANAGWNASASISSRRVDVFEVLTRSRSDATFAIGSARKG
jgi:hypothetical protein